MQFNLIKGIFAHWLKSLSNINNLKEDTFKLEGIYRLLCSITLLMKAITYSLDTVTEKP